MMKISLSKWLHRILLLDYEWINFCIQKRKKKWGQRVWGVGVGGFFFYTSWVIPISVIALLWMWRWMDGHNCLILCHFILPISWREPSDKVNIILLPISMNFTIVFLELSYVVYLKTDSQLTIYKIFLFLLKKKTNKRYFSTLSNGTWFLLNIICILVLLYSKEIY